MSLSSSGASPPQPGPPGPYPDPVAPLFPPPEDVPPSPGQFSICSTFLSCLGLSFSGGAVPCGVFCCTPGLCSPKWSRPAGETPLFGQMLVSRDFLQNAALCADLDTVAFRPFLTTPVGGRLLLWLILLSNSRLQCLGRFWNGAPAPLVSGQITSPQTPAPKDQFRFIYVGRRSFQARCHYYPPFPSSMNLQQKYERERHFWSCMSKAGS